MEEFKALNPLYDTYSVLKTYPFRFSNHPIRSCEDTQRVLAYPVPHSIKTTAIHIHIFAIDKKMVKSPFDYLENFNILDKPESQTYTI